MLLQARYNDCTQGKVIPFEASIAEVYPIQQQCWQLGRDFLKLDHSHVIFGRTQRFREALNSSAFAKKSS